MKKMILSLLMLLSSPTLVAEPMECTNLSDDYYEDVLRIDWKAFTATYFDNDLEWSLDCKLDGVQVKCCTLIDDCDSSRMIVEIESDGRTYLIEKGNKNQSIEYHCPLS